MKRDLMRLAVVFGGVILGLVLFGWIQSIVGYEAFAWGGTIGLAALVVIGILVELIIQYRKRKDTERES